MQRGLFDVSSIPNSTNGSTKVIYTLIITQLVTKGLLSLFTAALISPFMRQILGALNSTAIQ